MPIVFVSERAREGIGDLYVMSADGGAVERLTDTGNFYVPAWSPDGLRVAFRQVSAVDSALGVLTREDPTPVLLVDGEDPQYRYRGGAWAPDGELFAYPSTLGSERLVIWAVRRDGTGRERLFPELDSVQNAVTWSRRDAARVAYVTGQSLDDSNIWVAGSGEYPEPTNITTGRVFAPVYPRWSPSGTKIAFAAFPRLPDGSVEGLQEHDSPTGGPDEEIYVVDVETQELTRITDNAFQEIYPCWSPDETALLVQSDRDGDQDLWLLPLDQSSDARNLTNDAAFPAEDGMPDWYVGEP